jgi:hypothetical protein
MVGFLYFETQRWDLTAGAFASLAIIKPHLVYLVWPALLFWAIDRRRWKVLLGGGLAGLVATAIPLVRNPAVLQQYWYALNHDRPPVDVVSPTLGTFLQMGFGEGHIWLRFVPPVVGLSWLSYYWLKHRRSWKWPEQLPLLLLASFLTSFYGAWTCDRVILLVPVIQAGVWTVQGRGQLITWSGLAMYLLIDALAPTLYFLESSGSISEPVEPAIIELSLGFMTPALFLGYLVLRWQANRELSPALGERDGIECAQKGS